MDVAIKAKTELEEKHRKETVLLRKSEQELRKTNVSLKNWLALANEKVDYFSKKGAETSIERKPSTVNFSVVRRTEEIARVFEV